MVRESDVPLERPVNSILSTGRSTCVPTVPNVLTYVWRQSDESCFKKMVSFHKRFARNSRSSNPRSFTKRSGVKFLNSRCKRFARGG